jgi:murein DD-endopeptidase MepM/ murein hydrolase activator NlpD
MPTAKVLAAAAAAQRAAAARSAAYAAAQARLDSARNAYDAAKLAYAGTKAKYDDALSQADLVHSLAGTARSAADSSRRVLAALVRSLVQQQSGSATADVLFGGAGDTLLFQLGTLAKLSDLTGNLDAIRHRVDADESRAATLEAQDQAAQDVVRGIPVAEALAAMEAAGAAFDQAQAQLEALGQSAQASLAGLTPLKDLLATAGAGRLSGQGWAMPAVGRITDVFGPRPIRPLPGVGAVHYGTDIGAACGAAIYAATSGVVQAVGSLGTYGNWILIDHGDGIETGYAHLAAGETLVAVGEAVIAGQVIGGVGSTGASTGCHLHFEVRVDGTRVDPQPFLAARGIALGG